MLDIHTSIYRFMRAYRDKGDTISLVRGTKKYSFERFFKEIDRVAGGLYALGVRRGDAVMITLPNIEQGVVAAYAASKLGAVASFIHPKLSEAEFRREFELQKPKAIFLSDINLSTFGRSSKGAARIYCPYGVYAYVGLPRSSTFEEYSGSGEEPALYMHSGGTTGAPKTVILSARAVNALADNIISSLGGGFGFNDVMLAALPLFHGYGFCVGVHAALSVGASAALLPKFSAEKAVRTIKRAGVTLMAVIPRMMKKLLSEESFEGGNVTSLKNVYVGGDALDEGLRRRFEERLLSSGCRANVLLGYGLTEVGSCVVVTRPGEGKADCVGKIHDGMEFAVADDKLNFLPPGEAGELLLSGAQLMSGYLGDGEASGQALIEKDGKIWLKTGDIFRADAEGNLYFAGRKKRLIKIAGMNVFPSEIERVARGSGAGECVAAEYTETGKKFIELVVEGALSDADKKRIKNAISAELSHWHTPSRITCVEKLPRTSIGKIDFERLRNEDRKDRKSRS